MDNQQSFVDKLGSIDSNTVFLVNGVFVVLINQHIEHVAGTSGGVVLQREIQDGSIGLGDLQTGKEPCRRAGDRVFSNCHRFVGSFTVKRISGCEYDVCPVECDRIA